MKILITFVGTNDVGKLAGLEDDGAILTTLSERDFDYIYLLYTRGNARINDNMFNYLEISEYLKTIILENNYCKESDVIIQEFICNKIAVHTEVYASLVKFLNENFSEIDIENNELFALISSGTPQMQASWILIAEADVFPVKLIRAIEKRYSVESRRTEDVALLTNIRDKLNKLKVYERRLGSKNEQNYSVVNDVNNLNKKQIQIAKSNNHILIYGETGVGKEVLARTLHDTSERKVFFPINCAGIPEQLLESELFGHKKGAFTGANYDKKGIVKEYENGSLFLDEINSMPISLQAKLLRFIESGEFRSVGSSIIEKSNIRIIAAANEKIQKLVEEEKFRLDLYYRLRTFELHIPPLRKRKEQIPELIEKLKLSNSLENLEFEPDALEALKNYRYPGNVRELIIILNRLNLNASSDNIKLSNIKQVLSELTHKVQHDEPEIPTELHGKAYKLLRTMLTKIVLSETNGNTAEAGRILGVTHNSIKKWNDEDFG
ncbi:MAG: sigma 54-interacting transcriptional regulator [Ignavibacteriae bacterium]|nr:sigma 54-interacting transcriptional regulator [Ignavibacteriota bacterium]